MSTEIYNQNENNKENILQEKTPQRIEDSATNEYSKEALTNELFDTDLNLERTSNSEFNLSLIKKELTDIKQKEMLSNYHVKPFENMEEEISEEKKQRNVEQIIKQWLNLQKIIKEKITLDDVIIHQQTSDTNSLKKLFREYYEAKLKTRKNYEDMNELNMGNKDQLNNPSFYIYNDAGNPLKEVNDPIKNLLFLLRNNYDYLLRLLSLMNQSDFSESNNRKKVNSLVELFNNQFYGNILIPNPEQQELLILIYKLLEEEIITMGIASPDDFLNNNSFLGVFLSSYSKRPDIIGYISMMLNPIILSIDNEGKECLDLSINSIKKYLDKEDKEKRNMRKSYHDRMDFNRGPNALKDFLFSRIPKTKIKFKNNFELEAEKEKEDEIKNNPTSKDDNDPLEKEKNMHQYKKLRRTITERNTFNFNKDLDYNNDFKYELNQDKLFSKLRNTKDEDLKDFFIKQLELMNDDPNKYTNEGILKILDFNIDNYNDKKEQSKQEAIVENYKENFLFIKKIIGQLLQKIVDKIFILPYPLRCICKIIYLLISKKFPHLSKYTINSFIGKFILNKCIFPVLNLETKNAVDLRIFSLKTKKCLDLIINVLSKANSGTLYDTYTDPEKTIFNQYLIEIIPILNKFYEKIIDVQLPKILDDLINKTNKRMEENENKKFFNFKHKKVIKKDSPAETPNTKDIDMPPPLFNYFSENPDEILHLQSICFSIEDILFMVELIGKNIQLFKDLPKYTFFEKTYKRIANGNNILKNIINENLKNKNQRPFFLIFKEEKNAQLEKLMKQKKEDRSTFESSDQDSDLIYKRIKFCIKTILKGLNLLNNKDFAYLNFANSTDKFFSALKYTLDELGEYSELSNNIPLKWYAQYIYSYKKELSDIYQRNDFSKLYEEIYKEESNILNELKSLSSTVITRDGMNLRCAEKIKEKAEYELKISEEAKKYIQIENFIDSVKIEVCLMPNDEMNSKTSTNNDNYPIPLKINDIKSCEHNSNSNEKNPNHICYIRDFISKFSDNITIKSKHNKIGLSNLVNEDIKKGEKKYQIDKIISMYMYFVKRQVKSNAALFGNFKKEEEVMEILEKIENYILRHIYKYIYPTMQIEGDKNFYRDTRKLEWIKPENLEIKKLYVNQLKFAEKYIIRLDKAYSVFDKLDCIKNAYVTMNNTIKFISGKNEDAGQDELTPLFQYILIKSHPEYLVTNINYLKCFLSEDDLIGQKGFYVSQMESAYSFIVNINCSDLKMSKEEFDLKTKQALNKYNQEKKITTLKSITTMNKT